MTGSWVGASGQAASETEGADGGGMVGGSSATGDREGVGSDARIPPDVGDGSDDDIVARQLREAAVAEDDPELRDKLWDEYRRYKASVAAEGFATDKDLAAWLDQARTFAGTLPAK